MNDDEVSVKGDGRGGQRGDVDADGDRHRNDPAEALAEDPRRQQTRDGRERNGQQAHDDVREGQVGDEDVGDRLEGSIAHHYTNYKKVAEAAEQEDDAVGRDEEDEEPGQVHDALLLSILRHCRRRVVREDFKTLIRHFDIVR